MIRVLAFVLASAAASVASAQLVFDGVSGSYSGSPFDASFAFLPSPVTLNASQFDTITVVGTPGANGFSVNFLDESFSLLFSMTFTSLNMSGLIPYGANTSYAGISALSIGPADLGLSYGASITSMTASLAAIPESSTVGLIAGGVALAGAVVYRRRKTA